MHKVAKQFAVIILVATLACVIAACNRSNATSGGGGDAAATVNGKNITLEEVNRNVNILYGGQQTKFSPLDLANARLRVLQNLIQEEVLYQRAEKDNLLPKEEEITQAINAKKQQARMTEEEWQQRMRESGETDQTLRERARKDLAIQKLVEKTVGQITIRENEVEEFFKANVDRFVNPRGIELAAIVSDPLDSAGGYQNDAKSEQEARTKIETIYSQLKGGSVDFASVAFEQSEDPSRERGGAYGFFTEDQLKQSGIPQELISSLFGSMPVGGFTQPIRLGDGRFFILKLTSRRLQDEKRNLDSPGVRDEIKEMLISERQKTLNAALGVVAMNEAKIVNHLAASLLKDPSTLGGMQPVSPGTAAAPASGESTAGAQSAGSASK